MFVLSKVFLISVSTVISTDITFLLFWLKFAHIFPILFSLQDTSQVTLNIYQLLNVNVLPCPTFYFETNAGGMETNAHTSLSPLWFMFSALT